MEVALLLLAAGRSVRFGNENKLLAEISPGKSVLRHVIANTIRAAEWTKVVIVANNETAMPASEVMESLQVDGVIVQGGERRQDSVRAGLRECAGDYVLIHDCARPFASKALFERVIDNLAPDCCVIPGLPVQDTIYIALHSGGAIEVLDRSALTAVQTPQGFPLGLIQEMHGKPQIIDKDFSDDGSIFVKHGLSLKIVAGEEENFKITTEFHISYARFVFDKRTEEETK